jgi:1-acyl-sn-glycerol-3-phosphate acyltransferase
MKPADLRPATGEDLTTSGKEDPSRSDDPRIRKGERGSRRFWRGADPAFLETLERHNARVGSLGQRTLARFVLLFVVGPFAFLLTRILFRIRVVDGHHLDNHRTRIVAVRHFYEWDPFLTLYSALWTRALVRPWQLPYNLGGHFWVKTPLRRLLSWSVGLIGVRRGGGIEQDALRRASEILNGPAGSCLAIYPTGPTGRSDAYEVKPGVGYLSLSCPGVPVIPVAIFGLRDLQLRDVLTLRRPQLTYVMGEPFRACDLPANHNHELVEVIRQRIERAWQEADAHFARTRTVAVPLPLPVLDFEAEPLPELD